MLRHYILPQWHLTMAILMPTQPTINLTILMGGPPNQLLPMAASACRVGNLSWTIASYPLKEVIVPIHHYEVIGII